MAESAGGWACSASHRASCVHCASAIQRFGPRSNAHSKPASRARLSVIRNPQLNAMTDVVTTDTRAMFPRLVIIEMQAEIPLAGVAVRGRRRTGERRTRH